MESAEYAYIPLELSDIMAVKTIDSAAKILVADDRRVLASSLAGAVQGNQELFLKYRERYHDNYSDTKKSDLIVRTKGTPAFCGIVPEFTALCSMYDLAPENVATPIALVRRSRLWEMEHSIQQDCIKARNSIDGYSVAGYVVEYIPGQTLAAYYENAKTKDPAAVKEFTALARQLIEVLNKLNRAGVGHGDANLRNVIVNGKGVLKLIDPISIDDDPDYAIYEDSTRMSDLERKLRRLNRKTA